MSVNRRDFVLKAAGFSAAAFAATLSEAKPQVQPSNDALPGPDSSGIEHVVVVMQENRSFDHLLGWMPNANGVQTGLSYPNHNGEMQPTHRLTSFTGCPHPDPDHSYAGGRSEYNNGNMNGWLRTSTNDSYSIGYYEEADLPLFGKLARNFTTLSNYFASILACTFPNRMFQHAAQTDRLNNSSHISKLPTIWDRLQDAHVSCRYYYHNAPFLALWGKKYIPISRPYSEFAEDVAKGQLPAVSFIDPLFSVGNGLGNDDHPHADMRMGEIFLRDVVTTLANSSMWANTVLVINRDEWGGFFDHVRPPRVIAPNSVDRDLIDGKALLGCRVPTLVISPFARGNPAKPRINSLLYDHTSVLKLIAWRWGLNPLTARDASGEVANLALALDLDQPDTSVPALPEIARPEVEACRIQASESLQPDTSQPAINDATAQIGNGADEEPNDFLLLLRSNLMEGWPLPADPY
jgi:phospholipase C